MNLQELVDEIREKKPHFFDEGLTDKQALRLLRTAFHLLGRKVDATYEGRVVLRGFGSFLVSNAERGEGGSRAMRRVVRFMSAKQADRLPG